jgi:hypothetical protein
MALYENEKGECLEISIWDSIFNRIPFGYKIVEFDEKGNKKAYIPTTYILGLRTEIHGGAPYDGSLINPAKPEPRYIPY